MQDRYGRNGTDRLNRFLLIVALVWFVLSRVGVARSSIPPVLLVAVTYYRLFSRNIAKRYQENVMYCQVADRVKAKFGINSTHRIYRCPSCGQRIRVPRGKGRIEIRCPKCNAAFIKRS